MLRSGPRGNRRAGADAGGGVRQRTPARADMIPAEGGGTPSRVLILVKVAGRSPRVRGSCGELDRAADDQGSIPASAGEPGRDCPVPDRGGVDPRECGGAGVEAVKKAQDEGRSPRVRGSRAWRRLSDDTAGSIPASAGEPAHRASRLTRQKVDPRECGGASTGAGAISGTPGRSPRVRGSRPKANPRRKPRGSIPASAGEPLPAKSLIPFTMSKMPLGKICDRRRVSMPETGPVVEGHRPRDARPGWCDARKPLFGMAPISRLEPFQTGACP